MARFGRVLTAMVTPFGDDGTFDPDAAARLAQWLTEHGSDGLVLAGTTGESPTITDDEQIALFRAVRETVTVPLVGGTGGNDTAHSIELTRRAAETGLDAVLVVTPYYNRPSQAGIEAHFRAVAESTDLPVMIYDIPVRTGRKVATTTLLRLIDDVPNIVAVKDAAGDPPESARLIAGAAPGFELYSGDDGYTLPLLSVGAVGVVSVASHWAGPVFADMVACHEKGDVAGAIEANQRLIPSFDYESTDDAPNPLPAKAMMRVLGHAVGHCRPPMGPEPPDLADRARVVAAALGLEV